MLKSIQLVVFVAMLSTLMGCGNDVPPLTYFERDFSYDYNKLKISVKGSDGDGGGKYSIDWGDGSAIESYQQSGNAGFSLEHDYSLSLPARDDRYYDGTKSYIVTVTGTGSKGKKSSCKRAIEMVVPKIGSTSLSYNYQGSSYQGLDAEVTGGNSNVIFVEEQNSTIVCRLSVPKTTGNFSVKSSSNICSIEIVNKNINKTYTSKDPLATGSIVVTEANSARIKGTFSGTCYNGGSSINISNGSFEIYQ
jgi:hypothetical protein